MPFFQNPFNTEFYGVLNLADRHHSPTFKISGNINDSFLMRAWNPAPYNLSVDTDLTINFSLYPDSTGIHRVYTALTIDVTASAAAAAAVTVEEIVTDLNNDGLFSTYFEAIADRPFADGTSILLIRAKSNFPRETARVYISNGSAESVLRFNARAGVAELPSFFSRHTVANALDFSDSNALLIQLDPLGVPDDAAIVDGAGLDSSTVQEDWQLLRGKSGLFKFKKQTVDASNRVTEVIEYHAGAVVGDFAKKTTYTYTAAKTSPDEIFEEPYVLTSGDLITP